MRELTLDSRMLNDLYGGSCEDVRFILQDYLSRHDEIVSSLRRAYQSGVEALLKCVHFHSSSFGYIGVPQLTTECREFEQECKNAGDISSITPGFNRLLNRIDQSVTLVKEELSRLEKA